jgi:signal transduction histidine kinase
MFNAGAEPPPSDGPDSSPDAPLRLRELEVAREIASAFLRATYAVEVYRFALRRLTALVQASFASVFLRDPADPALLKLECAQNWPQSAAFYLSHLRIRVGRGPTGRAVAERRAVEIEDILAAVETGEWSQPAAELGFRSMISLPLITEDEAFGALSFYFAEPRTFSDDERHLLTLVADQLAALSRRAAQVDELREANRRLQRQNEALLLRAGDDAEVRRLKDEFLANVSHELRTPLTSILGYTFLLANDGQATPAQLAMLERIDEAGNALLHGITEMLELAHVKLGREELAIAAHDALRLARQAAERAGPAPPNIRLTIEPADGAMAICTDGERVVKILARLLENAFKFTAEGEVSLSVHPSPEGEWVEWRVQDSGIGIPTEELPHIFEEFRQVDGAANRSHEGAGVGLALARAVAEMLAGEILVSSEPGTGSVFTLRLPSLPLADAANRTAME